jgi:hypothetical protein
MIGPAPLQGENAAAYDEFCAGFECLKPSDITEEIWVRDVDLTWEIFLRASVKNCLVAAEVPNVFGNPITTRCCARIPECMDALVNRDCTKTIYDQGVNIWHQKS